MSSMPRWLSAQISALPMNPAPPVTTIRPRSSVIPYDSASGTPAPLFALVRVLMSRAMVRHGVFAIHVPQIGSKQAEHDIQPKRVVDRKRREVGANIRVRVRDGSESAENDLHDDARSNHRHE